MNMNIGHCTLFNRLKDIKRPKQLGDLPPETSPGIFPRLQAAITTVSQLLFCL